MSASLYAAWMQARRAERQAWSRLTRRVAALHSQGLPVLAIAAQVGAPRPVVAAILDELGAARARHRPWEETWAEGLGHARRYHRDHGHLRVRQAWVTEDGFRLGAWVKRMRERRARLTVEQVEALDGLGMVWRVGLGGPGVSKHRPS